VESLKSKETSWQSATPKDSEGNRLGKQRLKASVASFAKFRMYAFCARYR